MGCAPRRCMIASAVSSIWIMGMAELGADWKAELQCLVDQALKDFGVRCFWNVRTDLPLIPQAKVVVDQLSKHGGVRGLRRAEEIVRRLHGYESPLSSEEVSAGDVHNQVTEIGRASWREGVCQCV